MPHIWLLYIIIGLIITDMIMIIGSYRSGKRELRLLHSRYDKLQMQHRALEEIVRTHDVKLGSCIHKLESLTRKPRTRRQKKDAKED